MENSSSSTNNDHPGRFVRADDPLFPCSVLEEKYSAHCYRYQSSYFSVISRQNWTKVVELCLLVPNNYQHECFRTIGTNQVGFNSQASVWKNNCSLLPEEFRGVCVSGVVSSLSYRFVDEPALMFNFCSLVDSMDQEECFKQIGLGVAEWSSLRTQAESICEGINFEKGRVWCSQGVSLSPLFGS